MNTNNNFYTIIYTTVIVVIVAAVLAFVSQSLKGKQEANEKADTISQMLTAAKFGAKAEFQSMGNAAVLNKYGQEIAEAFTVGTDGKKNGSLNIANKEVYSPSQLKRQNYIIRGMQEGEAALPVFIFKNGITVVPVYGAGLWGPIWGYIGFEKDQKTIRGAYFDHDSETAGLGAKIKDDPAFQEEFCGEIADFGAPVIFEIVKGSAPRDSHGKSLIDNKIDAITGATMTSKGLSAAINTWLGVYSKYFIAKAAAIAEAEAAARAAEEAARAESENMEE